MRNLLKTWQDKRPGWTRRVKWYEEPGSIRLNFCDMKEGLEFNRIYTSITEATLDYERFTIGLAVSELMKTRNELSVEE